jgi:hypothetical protein
MISFSHVVENGKLLMPERKDKLYASEKTVQSQIEVHAAKSGLASTWQKS